MQFQWHVNLVWDMDNQLKILIWSSEAMSDHHLESVSIPNIFFECQPRSILEAVQAAHAEKFFLPSFREEFGA